MKIIRFFITIFVLSSLILILTNSAVCADWPEKTITIITGDVAGTRDYGARIWAEYMQKEWDVNVVVQNISGNIVSLRSFMKADDIYTLYYNNIGVIIDEVLGTSEINVLDDTTLLGIANSHLGSVIGVRSDLGVNNLKELFELSESRPDELTITDAYGTNTNVVVSMLRDLGLKVTPVDVGSSPDRLVALLGGHIDIDITPYNYLKPYDESGEVKVLAVTMPERQKAFPNVPTTVEQGYDVTLFVSFFFLGPKDAPQEMIDKINALFEKVNADPAYAERIFKGQTWEPFYMPSKEAEDFLREQRERLISLGLTDTD